MYFTFLHRLIYNLERNGKNKIRLKYYKQLEGSMNISVKIVTFAPNKKELLSVTELTLLELNLTCNLTYYKIVTMKKETKR